jgi:hypothetical protein
MTDSNSESAAPGGARRSLRARVPAVVGWGVATLAALAAVLVGVLGLDPSSLVSRYAGSPGADGPLAHLNILPRETWKAEPLTETPAPLGEPHRITVHHEGGRVFSHLAREATARTLRGIQRHHRHANGWSDIAYHYVVDRRGRIWEGRLATQIGAHAGSLALNERNLGVLVLGNFDLQVPSGAQTQSLRALLDALCRLWKIPPSEVRGHREVRVSGGLGPTRCPGRYLEGWLKRYREDRATPASGGDPLRP